MRPDEESARLSIEACLGVPVVFHDDNSSEAMHDLDVMYSDRPAGAVEVTAAADGKAISVWQLLHEEEGRWVESSIDGGWFVKVSLNARVKKLRTGLPELLSELEATGQTRLDVSLQHGRHHLVDDAKSLGVRRAVQNATDWPGSIYFTLDLPKERSGGAVADDTNALARWVGEWLRSERPRHVAKLGQTTRTERHAYVIVPGFPLVPFSIWEPLMRRDSPAPTLAPDLPAEITHVWIASGWKPGSSFRWSATDGWSRFEVLPSALDSLTSQ